MRLVETIKYFGIAVECLFVDRHAPVHRVGQDVLDKVQNGSRHDFMASPGFMSLPLPNAL